MDDESTDEEDIDELLNEKDEENEKSQNSDDTDDVNDDDQKNNDIIDKTETETIALRRLVYLIIQSSLDFEECAHKLVKVQLKPNQEVFRFFLNFNFISMNFVL